MEAALYKRARKLLVAIKDPRAAVARGGDGSTGMKTSVQLQEPFSEMCMRAKCII